METSVIGTVEPFDRGQLSRIKTDGSYVTIMVRLMQHNSNAVTTSIVLQVLGWNMYIKVGQDRDTVSVLE